MKKTALALAALAGMAATVAPTAVFAQDAAAPASPISFNIGVVSDYRYRGISQSKLNPALQGGIDYAQGPFYIGTWLSTIQWVHDAGKIVGASSGDAPIEWDLYAGTKGEIAKDFSYDVGVLGYFYLGQKFHNIGAVSPNTGEVYVALTYAMITGKVSVAPSDLFGVVDSKGSQYYDLSANFDLGSGFSLVPHAGYQNIRHNSPLSYADYSLALGKDFGGGLTGSIAVVATDADKDLYITSNGKSTARTGPVVGIKYSF